MANETKTLVVTEAELENYDPALYDAHDNRDGTFTLVPVLWHDEASYAAYQGDPFSEADYERREEEETVRRIETDEATQARDSMDPPF